MELCVKNCRYGYQLIPASKVGECASCLCQPGNVDNKKRNARKNNIHFLIFWKVSVRLCKDAYIFGGNFF